MTKRVDVAVYETIKALKDRLEELKQKIIAGEIDVPESRTELDAFLQNLPK